MVKKSKGMHGGKRELDGKRILVGKRMVVALLCFILLLLCISIGGYCIHILRAHRTEQKNWTEQLDKWMEENRKAIIIRRVSEQLEEVAYQQKAISDEQRQEAVKQKKMAEQMQQLAEGEKESALRAKTEALEAYRKAEEQKRLADRRREEALEARRRSDTLAGLALGRSLGTLAMSQYKVGKQELAALLGYYAYKYTSDNKGDCYQPAVLGALSLVSESSVVCFKHKGAIRDIARLKQGEWVSVSECGEVVQWKQQGENWDGRVIYEDLSCDFRQVVWDEAENIIYALTYSGEAIELKGDSYGEVRRGTITAMSGDWERMGFTLKDGVVCKPIPGEEWKDTMRWGTEKKVSAFAFDSVGEYIAVGDESGKIILITKGDRESKVLLGHVSAITALAFYGNRLLSVSYDGKLNLWDLQAEKIEAVAVATYSEWLYCLQVDIKEEKVICGGASGALYVVSVSPERMAKKLKKTLNRDFTAEEREYYLNGRKGGIE